MDTIQAHSTFQHLVIQRPNPPPTSAQIDAIETLLGSALPASFRDFLCVSNGGYLEYIIDVPTGDGRTEPISFCGLFSADEGVCCDETLVGQILCERMHAKIPAGVLPFARDGGGSVIYLDLTADGRGRVVAFVEGLPSWAGGRHDSWYIEIAGSFDEYVAKLRLDRAAVLDHLAYDVDEMTRVESIEAFLEIGMPGWRKDKELHDAVAAARQRARSTET